MQRIIYIIIGICFRMTAPAQDSLTIEVCRSMAVEHNRQLQQAREQRAKAHHETVAMKANFLPKLDFHAMDIVNTTSGNIRMPSASLPIYSYNAQAGQFLPSVITDASGNVMGLSQYAEYPAMTLKYRMHNLLNASLSVMQPIYMGGKISAGYTMTQIGQRIADENIRMTESEVIVSTDEAYALAVKAREMTDVAKSYEALLQELRKTVESAVRHGMRTRNDLMKVQVKLNQASLAITRAENAHTLACMNLCQIIGLPLSSPIHVAKPDITALVIEEIMSASDDNLQVLARPEYAILREQAELARQQLRITCAEYLPNLALFAAGGYSNGGKVTMDATNSLTGTQRIYDQTLIDQFSGSVGITFSMPVFHFGERKGKIRSAKSSIRMAEIEIADKREKMTLELAQAYNTLREQLTASDIARQSVEQAAENLRLSQSAYNSGVETLSDLLEAQSLWQSAMADEIDARTQLIVALSKWRRAAGKH